MKPIFATMILMFAIAASHAALQKAPGPEGPIPDLKPVLEELPILVETRSWTWAWVTGGVLLVGLVTTFALGARKKTEAETISPYIRARKELEAARDSNNPAIVWNIFRNYVHARYGLKHGVTSGEIIGGLSAVITLRESTQADLTRLFTECEVASFSGGKETTPDLVERAMVLLNVLESQQLGIVPAFA